MLWLNACPKCKGTLYLENDLLFREKKCLQCGFIVYDDSSSHEEAAPSPPFELEKAA